MIEELLANFRGYILKEGIDDKAEHAIQNGYRLVIEEREKGFVYFELFAGDEMLFRIITEKAAGNACGAHQITSSSAKSGWGALGYEIAMCYHHHKSPKGFALMPDRWEVSPTADAVWKKYSTRKDVEFCNLDDMEADYDRQRTPEDPFDDSSIINPDEFESNPSLDNGYLDRAYRLNGQRYQYIYNIMNQLLGN